MIRTPFLTCVIKELARVHTALAQHDVRIAALQEAKESLQAQAQCLREYLRLVEAKAPLG